MKKDVDCQIFEDQLDGLVKGTLPEEGARQLRIHAASCPDCSMLLRVQEHLALPALEELEAQVPEDLLASVWPRVEAEVESGAGDVPAETGFPMGHQGGRIKRFSWLVPTLAAASVALLFSTGLLYSELKRSEAREVQLARQVGEMDRWMAGLDGGSGLVQRTAELAGGGKNRARAVGYALSGGESLTLDSLLDLLGRYPQGKILFDASQLLALSETTSRPPPELREILTLLGDALTTLGDADGVRVGEFAEWLASSSLPPDMIPASTPWIRA